MSINQSPPALDSPEGICPRCGIYAHFEVKHHDILKYENRGVARIATEKYAVLQCSACLGAVIVIERAQHSSGPMSPPPTWSPITWWPSPKNRALDSEAVPSGLSDAYSEGYRALSIKAPNAAVAMFRNALAMIVADHGSEEARKKGTLFLQIKQMVEDKTLYKTFGELATSVRELGNAGAHQESYEPVTVEQAEDISTLIFHLIDWLYLKPHQLASISPTVKRDQ